MASRAAVVLSSREDQRDVERDAGGGQFFQRAKPPGVAGTLIMRFLWPWLHCLPSST